MGHDWGFLHASLGRRKGIPEKHRDGWQPRARVPVLCAKPAGVSTASAAHGPTAFAQTQEPAVSHAMPWFLEPGVAQRPGTRRANLLTHHHLGLKA